VVTTRKARGRQERNSYLKFKIHEPNAEGRWIFLFFWQGLFKERNPSGLGALRELVPLQLQFSRSAGQMAKEKIRDLQK
jgi:hypothetical protein